MVMTATVISVSQNGLLVRNMANGQEVFVNFGNPRLFSPGDVVQITFNGMMTPSIPPQISATSIIRINTTAPTQPTGGSEIRGAVVLQVQNNALLIRDPSQNNRQATVRYAFARHFCVGQRVNVRFETVLIGERGEQIINATDVLPTC